MESVSLPLPVLIILIIIVLACVYNTRATNSNRAANEREFVESWEAKTSDQERKHQTQMKAAQDKINLKERVIGTLERDNESLEREKRSSALTEEELSKRLLYHQRESNNLKERLKTDKDASKVDRATKLIEQWDSVHDTLRGAGLVVNSEKDLADAIEKLLKSRDSAEASSTEAAFYKEKLASERAAKEAALKEFTKLQTRARTLESNNKDLRAAAKANSEPKNHSHEELDNGATAKLQKQLKSAQEATTEAESKLRNAKNTIRHKDREIAALNKQKDAEIAALRADLKKIEMSEATTSTSLQQELSQTKAELADAKKTIEYFGIEGQELWESNKSLMTQGQALLEMYNELNANFHAVNQTARKQKKEERSLKLQLRIMSFAVTAQKQTKAYKKQHGKIAQDALVRRRVAKGDQKISGLLSDLAARDQKISQLSHDLEWEKTLNNWTPGDDLPVLPNNDNVSNMVNGTDYTFPDDFFNDSLNNIGSVGNITDLDALISNGGLNNGDSSNIADLGALNGLDGSSTNGGLQYQQNGDQGLLNALIGSSGLNTNGDLLSEQNGDQDMSNALNGSSGLDINGGFLSEQNGDQDMSNALNGSSGLNTNRGFQAQQNSATAPSSSFTSGAQPSSSQQGGFQAHQHGISAPSDSSTSDAQQGSTLPSSSSFTFGAPQGGMPASSGSFTFGAPQGGMPASSGSFTFGAPQNSIPAPSNSFTVSTQQSSTSAPSKTFAFGAQPPNSEQSANATTAPSFSFGAPPSGAFTFGSQLSSIQAPTSSLALGARPSNNKPGTTASLFNLSTTQRQQIADLALPTSFPSGAQPANSQPSANNAPPAIFSAAQPSQPPAPQTTSSLSASQSSTVQKRPQSPVQGSSSNFGSSNDPEPLTINEIQRVKDALQGTVSGVDSQELHQVMEDNYPELNRDDPNGVEVFDLPPNVQRVMLAYVNANISRKQMPLRRRKQNTST
jgi:hypothetical protein